MRGVFGGSRQCVLGCPPAFSAAGARGVTGMMTALPQSASGAVPDPGERPQQSLGSADGQPSHVPSGDTRVPFDDGQRGGPPAKGRNAKDRPERPVDLPKPQWQDTTWAVDSTEPPGKVDGFVPETSREVPELGGPQRQVFENADGTTTVRHFTGRQLFQTSGQGWRRIDPTLVQQDNGEGWRSRADSEAKRFARSANARQLVAVELEGGQSYGFGVSGAKGSIGTVVGDTATYPNVPPARIWYCRRLRAGSRKRSFSSPRMRRRSGTSP